MDLSKLHSGHVVAKIGRYRFIVAKSFDTKTCVTCQSFIHRKTNYVRISKGNKTLKGVCGNCIEEEMRDYGQKTK